MEDEDISKFDEALSALAEEILEDAPEQAPHPLAAPPPPPLPAPPIGAVAAAQSIDCERRSALFSESIVC